jgi:predicted ArsR family transcriptional regulator
MSEQFSIFDPPRARNTDPETSHIAAAGVEAFAGEHHAKILQALDAPGTIHELAERTGLDHVQVARRMIELERSKWVIRLEETRPSPRGRPCRIWRRA